MRAAPFDVQSLRAPLATVTTHAHALRGRHRALAALEPFVLWLADRRDVVGERDARQIDAVLAFVAARLDFARRGWFFRNHYLAETLIGAVIALDVLAPDPSLPACDVVRAARLAVLDVEEGQLGRARALLQKSGVAISLRDSLGLRAWTKVKFAAGFALVGGAAAVAASMSTALPTAIGATAIVVSVAVLAVSSLRSRPCAACAAKLVRPRLTVPPCLCVTCGALQR